MRYRTINKGEILFDANADRFNERLNERIGQLESDGFTVQFDFVPQSVGFAVFLKYEKRQEIAECIAEEYELNGESATCGECPFFHKPTDKRVRRVECDCGLMCRAEHRACDIYYQILRTGRKMPGGGNDD